MENNNKLFTVEELYQFAKQNQQSQIISVTHQKIVEWDDSESDVEVATFQDHVLVKYSDGNIYCEDRKRFEDGKWMISPLTEAFQCAIKEMQDKKSVQKINEQSSKYCHTYSTLPGWENDSTVETEEECKQKIESGLYKQPGYVTKTFDTLKQAKRDQRTWLYADI